MLRLLQRTLPARRGYLLCANVHASSENIDAELRSNVRLLGKTLGDSINQYNPKAFAVVEELRMLGREWRQHGDQTGSFSKMVQEVKQCDTSTLLDVSRSFAHFLALANTAENHHRIHKLQASLIEEDVKFGLWPRHDSCVGSMLDILNNRGRTKDEVFKALKAQCVEIVLTAHPTEVNRKTMLGKLQRVRDILRRLESTPLTKYDEKRLHQQLRGEVAAMWGSDTLRRSKPSAVDEARSGLVTAESALWQAVPSFLRKLDDATRALLGQPLPLDCAPIRLASWMGGDRDGNPNVTPAVTREVSLLSHALAANLFLAEVTLLRTQLSMCQCTAELRAAVGESEREPYRAVLRQLEGRLRATAESAERQLSVKSNQFLDQFSPVFGSSGGSTHSKSAAEGSRAEPLRRSKELMEPLLLLHRSLVEVGLSDVADGALTDTIRRVAAFGLALMPIDIRQESTRHSEALDAITQYLGLGSYLEWDEARRRDWLLRELRSRRPLLPRNFDASRDAETGGGFTPTVMDTLGTFTVAASLGPESLGAYVISQCQQASDILAVMLLQQDAGVTPLRRVVPLFETLDDLQRAEATVEALFQMPVYKELIKGKQEIMVGYSDSAKDAGRLAASWTLYQSQVRMATCARQHGIELTFFHGKGGTVGRGGNPALYEAILAHPPETIQGRFRVTEQGEMITQNLGEQAVAERTLDLFTAGVLAERFVQRPEVKPEWAACMDRMAATSCEAYRGVVRGEPRFVPYFRTATPELELAGLNVGSRPSKRNPKGGVESLRAIPWVFAWTQTRLNLPTWLGVGEALAEEIERDGGELLRGMYRDWPWFHTLIDLLEMIMVKSDATIAANYDAQLVTDPESLALGRELRQRMEVTSAALLKVSGHSSPQAHNALLQNSLAVRNPYVDPLNVIQAELLRRLRQADQDGAACSDEERAILQDALLVTINGIANGMRNSG